MKRGVPTRNLPAIIRGIGSALASTTWGLPALQMIEDEHIVYQTGLPCVQVQNINTRNARGTRITKACPRKYQSCPCTLCVVRNVEPYRDCYRVLASGVLERSTAYLKYPVTFDDSLGSRSNHLVQSTSGGTHINSVLMWIGRRKLLFRAE
jgi:hypothetical protein